MKKYIIVVIALIYIFLGVNVPFAEANIWTQKVNLGGTTGAARHAAVSFSIGSKGYIGTGWDGSSYYSDFWEYDSGTWTQKADFGGGARAHAVGFSIGSKGYIGTGYNGSSDCKDFWEYDPDPTVNKWTQKADFGGGVRESAVGFSIGSKGYVGTGVVYDEEGTAIANYKDFWEYDPDPTVNKWTQKADFGGVARDSAIGFSIGSNSKGYIGTGWDVDTNPLKDFWEYDPTVVPDGTWTQKADLGGKARYYAVGFSIDSKGYIGTGWDGSSDYSDFWEYDPTVVPDGTWTQKADFGGGARDSVVGFSIDSKGYIGTGFDGSSEYKDFWEYDPYDRIPDQFTFTDQSDVALNTIVTSNTITVSGIDAAASISITGGTYSINGVPSTSVTVINGDQVTIQLTSSGSYSTKTSATLTIGGVSATFNVTTQAAPASSGGGGGGCFIATAAFGSPMAGQVEILRQFRDRYLLTNVIGRKFVAWYYRNGPAAASYIKDKPLAKAAVRVTLYPLIGVSFLLISGYLPFVIVGLLLSALFFLRFRPKKLSAK